MGPSLLGAEFVRGRLCQGPSLLGAEMSRNLYSRSMSIVRTSAQTGSRPFTWKFSS